MANKCIPGPQAPDPSEKDPPVDPPTTTPDGTENILIVRNNTIQTITIDSLCDYCLVN